MKRYIGLRFRRFLRRILHLGDSPDRTAFAFALGVFLGFSPLVLLHTILGIFLAFVFRLNRLAVLVGVYLNTPWTLAPVASLGTALGLFILGRQSPLPDLALASMLSREFWTEMRSDVRDLLLPFFIGNTIIALVAGVIAFFVFRRILVRYRARKTRRAARRAV